jgi:superfamily II DNA or RNA helicase
MNATEIQSLAAWSTPVEVNTRNGPRMLSKAQPTERFSIAWRAGKDDMKASGLSWSKDMRTGDWSLMWWQPMPAAIVEARTAGLSDDEEGRLRAITPLLLGYQLASTRAVALAIKRHQGALDASDTGTGKTFVALAACFVLDRPIYVVCPKAVIPSWKRAAVHYGITLAGVCNYELLRRGGQSEVKLVGKDKDEHFEWQLPKGTVIIMDEIHRMKDYKTLNSAMGLAALRQGYDVMGLSATAADNPMQMKFSGLLTKCFPVEKAFFGWMLRNGVSKGRWGMEFNGGQQVLNRIHHDIFPEHGTRLRIADLGDAFPETQIAAEAYDMNGEASKIDSIYAEMEAEIARIEASEKADKGACILVELLRARQRSEVLKIPAIAAMAQDAIEEGMSVAVFVNFDDSADALMAKLETTCTIRGGQTAEAREKCIADFQCDKSPVIVCNIKAGGVGVSLHGSPTSRRRLSIICPTFSGQDLKQALGRVWRANGAKSIQRIFFAAGTVEEKICQQVNQKIARIDTLNDGDLTLGVERSHMPANAPSVAASEPGVQEQGQTTVQAPTPVQRPARTEKQIALDAIAETITDAQSRAILAGLKHLASVCDGARDQDGCGFAATDVEIGHSLAGQSYLTARQAAIGQKLCCKYQKQLGPELVQLAGVKLKGE